MRERDGTIGEHEAHVLLQTVAQPLTIVGAGVELWRGIHPDLAATQLDREHLHVIGELVEGAAGAQVEARRVPVAGENAVAAGAAIQRETHVWAAIVQRKDLRARTPEHKRPPVHMDGLAISFVEIGERGGALPARRRCRRRGRGYGRRGGTVRCGDSGASFAGGAQCSRWRYCTRSGWRGNWP